MIVNPLLTEQGQGWFGGAGSWFPSFNWGGGENPAPQNPPLTPAPAPPQPSPAAPAPLPPPNTGEYARQAPEGGGGFTQAAPNASSATIDPLSAPPAGGDTKKYSFLDNPGASDALVAFGAAMLKAPSFNQGLGDAALAVNKVAQQYRAPTEAEYSRARELAKIKAIANGKGVSSGGATINRDILYRDAEGNTWFDAVGPNGEAGLFNQETGQFTTQGVPGLTRDVYDYGSNRNRRAASKDADLEADFATRIPAIAANAAQFDALYKLAADDSTGIDSSFTTRVGRQLETLLPGSGFTDLDPNNITEFNNRIQKAALDYASGAFKGQGQVTENERLMIQRAVGEPGTLTKQSAMKVFQIMRDAELRKLHMYQEWRKSPKLRDSYEGNFASYQTDVLTQATLDQINGSDTPSAAPSSSGGRRPLTDIFGP